MALSMAWATALQAADGLGKVYTKVTGGSVANDELANAAIAVMSYAASKGFAPAPVGEVADPAGKLKAELASCHQHFANPKFHEEGAFANLNWAQLFALLLKLLALASGGEATPAVAEAVATEAPPAEEEQPATRPHARRGH